MAAYKCPQASLYNEPEQETNNIYFTEVIKVLSECSRHVTDIVEHGIYHV